MDNRTIDIKGNSRKAFNQAIELAFENAPGGKATHYLQDDNHGFVLFWGDDKNAGAIKLPVPLKYESASSLIWEWLQQQPDSMYKFNLDHDGDNGRGWRVYNGPTWNFVENCSHYAFIAVYPIWAWYGK